VEYSENDTIEDILKMVQQLGNYGWNKSYWGAEDEMAIEAFKEGLMSPKVYRAATVNMILQHEKTYHPSVVMSNEVAVIPPMDIDTNLITNSSALISVK